MKPLASNSYTDEERVYLRRWYPTQENAEIGRALGRSADGVRKMAHKMQLEKSPEFTAAARARSAGHGGRPQRRTSLISVDSLGRLGNKWHGVNSIYSFARMFQESAQ